jgi:hypothetical protein
LNGEENKTNKMKKCTVPIEKAQELCPDPRIFNCCVRSLSVCNSEEEMREKIESWNKFCEENKCPYLKEGKDHLKRVVQASFLVVLKKRAGGFC